MTPQSAELRTAQYGGDDPRLEPTPHHRLGHRRRLPTASPCSRLSPTCSQRSVTARSPMWILPHGSQEYSPSLCAASLAPIQLLKTTRCPECVLVSLLLSVGPFLSLYPLPISQSSLNISALLSSIFYCNPSRYFSRPPHICLRSEH